MKIDFLNENICRYPADLQIKKYGKIFLQVAGTDEEIKMANKYITICISKLGRKYWRLFHDRTLFEDVLESWKKRDHVPNNVLFDRLKKYLLLFLLQLRKRYMERHDPILYNKLMFPDLFDGLFLVPLNSGGKKQVAFYNFDFNRPKSIHKAGKTESNVNYMLHRILMTGMTN